MDRGRSGAFLVAEAQKVVDVVAPGSDDEAHAGAGRAPDSHFPELRIEGELAPGLEFQGLLHACFGEGRHRSQSEADEDERSEQAGFHDASPVLTLLNAGNDSKFCGSGLRPDRTLRRPRFSPHPDPLRRGEGSYLTVARKASRARLKSSGQSSMSQWLAPRMV